MTREEFKKRWDSSENGDGITFDDIADCAIEWGIAKTPRIMDINSVRFKVLREASTSDYKEWEES
jgi:hypothetical protein